MELQDFTVLNISNVLEDFKSSANETQLELQTEQQQHQYINTVHSNVFMINALSDTKIQSALKNARNWT